MTMVRMHGPNFMVAREFADVPRRGDYVVFRGKEYVILKVKHTPLDVIDEPKVEIELEVV